MPVAELVVNEHSSKVTYEVVPVINGTFTIPPLVPAVFEVKLDRKNECMIVPVEYT